MRTFAKAALGVAVLAFAASVSTAQGPGGFGGGAGMAGPALLLNKSVQDELKLTDAQKADLKKIQDAQDQASKKARDDNQGDREKIQAAMKEVREKTAESLKTPITNLKPEQAKRFHQIVIQVKGVEAFNDEDVRKELKLNAKQTEDISGQLADLKKDREELFKGLQRGDREKMTEAFKKSTEMSKAAMDKIAEGLTADQKKAWKDMTGEKFDIKFDFPGGGGGGKGDKKSDKSF